MKDNNIGKEFCDCLINRNRFQGDGHYTAAQFRNKYLKSLDNANAWLPESRKKVYLNFSNVVKISSEFANEAFSYFLKYVNDPKTILEHIILDYISDTNLNIILEELGINKEKELLKEALADKYEKQLKNTEEYIISFLSNSENSSYIKKHRDDIDRMSEKYNDIMKEFKLIAKNYRDAMNCDDMVNIIKQNLLSEKILTEKSIEEFDISIRMRVIQYLMDGIKCKMNFNPLIFYHLFNAQGE